MYNFLKVAASNIKLKVANPIYNSKKILEQIEIADKENIKIIVFPELCITAYSCEDLFFQDELILASLDSLGYILSKTKNIDMLITLSMPLRISNKLYNTSLLVHKGKILLSKAKKDLNYEAFENRYFASSDSLFDSTINILGQNVAISNNTILIDEKRPDIKISIEIGSELDAQVPSSTIASISGANIIVHPDSSIKKLGSSNERLKQIEEHSKKANLAYISASPSFYESSTNQVYSSQLIIAESASILQENDDFSLDSKMIFSEIDLDIIKSKNKNIKNSFSDIEKNIVYFSFDSVKNEKYLKRKINPYPYKMIEINDNDFTNEILEIQAYSLIKRLEHINCKKLVLGVSGGLDSTLAILVCIKAFDILGYDRKNIIAITMPGFGTSDRTYQNAVNLANLLNLDFREISIENACLEHFKNISFEIDTNNVTFENAQARERIQILFDIANMENAIVVGSGDLSELALGFATYNGDHMSMYSVNAGVNKTSIRIMVNNIAKSNFFEGKINKILLDILDTAVSPELLPSENGEISQKTEDIVGPYDLQDFFIYYFLNYGFTKEKIFYLAKNAFRGIYEDEIILKWLNEFYKRFFSSQFKRSASPDSAIVFDFGFSPRNAFKMPSDASDDIWRKND